MSYDLLIWMVKYIVVEWMNIKQTLVLSLVCCLLPGSWWLGVGHIKHWYSFNVNQQCIECILHSLQLIHISMYLKASTRAQDHIVWRKAFSWLRWSVDFWLVWQNIQLLHSGSNSDGLQKNISILLMEEIHMKTFLNPSIWAEWTCLVFVSF